MHEVRREVGGLDGQVAAMPSPGSVTQETGKHLMTPTLTKAPHLAGGRVGVETQMGGWGNSLCLGPILFSRGP